MKYKKITPEILKELQRIVGEAFVFYDAESLANYGHDETEKLIFLPEVVLKLR